MEAKIEKEGYIYLFPHSDAMQMSLFIHMFCICFFFNTTLLRIYILTLFCWREKCYFYQQEQQIFPIQARSPLISAVERCPLLDYFLKSYQNTERLIKRRKKNQLLCKRKPNPKHLKLFRVLLSDLSELIFSKPVCLLVFVVLLLS